MFFLLFRENKAWHFIQIVSFGYNLNEMSNFSVIKEEKKKKTLKMPSIAISVLEVKG